MKKVVALILVLMLVISTASAMPEGFVPLDNIQFARLEFMQRLISDTVLYEEIDGEYLYGAALMAILAAHPELYELAARAMVGVIDENSGFRNREETAAWRAALEREFGGIGVHVLQVANGLMITNVIYGGAAHDGGLLPNDVITEVDGVSLRGLTQDASISYVRGELGTDVHLLVSRQGEEDPLEFTLTRKVVEEIPVVYEILDDVIYIRIIAFTTRTDTYVGYALAAADEAGVTKVLLDLRNNGGGFMAPAISVAERFVYGERLIVTEQRREERGYTTFYSPLVDKRYDVVVLVNGLTASAAEVLAAAIQDNEVGSVVGVPTFGKATIQTINMMLWGDSITYTIAHYMTPNGEIIHGFGIFPDVLIANRPELFNLEEFGRFTYDRTYRVGESGYDVRLAREALDVLGIYVADTDSHYFDEALREAVLAFQYEARLYQSGLLCPNTLVNMYIRLQNTMVMRDVQFEAGIGVLRGINN